MRCEICLEEFPSPSWFKTATICAQCWDKIPADERAGRQQDFESFSALSSDGEDQGFNFGAACLTPLWLLFHGRVGIGLLIILYGIVSRVAGVFGLGWVILTIFINLIVIVYFGSVGNRIAKEHRGLLSFAEVKKSERGWNIAGIIVGLVVILPILVYNCYAIITLSSGQ